MVKVFDTVLAFSVVMLLLSLIVTACVQAVSALLDLRGQNLVKAVKLLLEQAAEADPGQAPGVKAKLHAHIEEIAHALVKHPAVASGYHRTAKALRSQEVLRLLEALRTGTELKGEARQALDAALQARVPGLTDEQLAGIKDAATKVAQTLFPGDPAKVQKALEEAAQKAVDQATASTRAFVGRVEGWFDTVMDRSSDVFQRQVRAWTVAFAFVLAFSLQLDSLSLLARLGTDDTLRQELTQNVAASLSLGEQVLGPAPSERAAQTLAQAHPDQAEALSGSLQAGDTCAQGARRLRAAPDQAALAQEFQDACQKESAAYVRELPARISEAGKLLEIEHLQLFPPDAPWTCAFWQRYLSRGGLVFLGTLVTAMLLSLGAPFWYNWLRQLANLRPMIAGKVEAKPAAGAGAAAAPAAKS